MTPLLAVEGIVKRYGAIPVLHGIGLEVAEGETFAIIGPNGAGKTTLFKVMTGETGCDAGRVSYDGADVTRLPAYQRVRRGIGRTFQVARVFGGLTALENAVVAVEQRLRAAGTRPGPWYAFRPARPVLDEARHWLDRLGLGAKGDLAARLLAHGDRKRLELAIALAGHPRVLMLDEPTAGMSPSDRRGAVELIARLRQEHRITVVMTEHDMDVIFGLADRLMVMNYGRRIACGPVAAVRADPTVRAVYLGQDDARD